MLVSSQENVRKGHLGNLSCLVRLIERILFGEQTLNGVLNLTITSKERETLRNC